MDSTSTMNFSPRYYYAGTTRVAMRTAQRTYRWPGSSTLNYLLGDHLDSQAAQTQCRQDITANSSWVETGELRYYPWGTERYTSGTTPTIPRWRSGQAPRFTSESMKTLQGGRDWRVCWDCVFTGQGGGTPRRKQRRPGGTSLQ